MKNRTIPGSILVMVAIATLSCSKTQDTAPERRVFGDPPQIETVEPNFFDTEHHLECDFTTVMKSFFCQFFGNDITFLPGPGWQVQVPHDGGPVSAEGGVFLDTVFSEVSFKVKVSDPNSSTGQSNILLVSASYQDPDPANKTESSLVLFDDGSFNKFKFPQKSNLVGEFCIDDAFGNCSCFLAKYDVVSGDDTSGDGTFSRKIALPDKRSLAPPADAYLQDCIMRGTGDTPILSTQGDIFEFKIEAVDRQGNLATWPVKLKAVVGTSSFACSGDPCACCFMQTSEPNPVCSGLDGVVTPGFPDGFCKSF